MENDSTYSLAGRFLSLRLQVVKPTSPDESTAGLRVMDYSGKTITINSKKEADLKLSPKLSLDQKCLPDG